MRPSILNVSLLCLCIGLCIGSWAGPAWADVESNCVLRVKFDAPEVEGNTDQISGLPVLVKTVHRIAGVDGSGIWFLFDYKAGIASRVEIPLTPRLKGLDTSRFSLEMWLSPKEVRHAVVLASSEPSGPGEPMGSTGPVAVRWRLGHRVWFSLRAEDGEDRLIQTGEGAISPITFPEPTWHHFLATYDGNVGAIYINGKLMGRRRWETKKSLGPLTRPLFLGGRGWERYRGGIDELAVYDRAFTAAEVAAHYKAQRKHFKPATPPARQYAGSLDGKTFRQEWCRLPLQGGHVDLSNTGLVSLTSRTLRWGRPMRIGTFGIANADGMKGRYWKSVSGHVAIQYGGRSWLELEGVSYRGLGVKQRVEVTPDDQIKFRYALWPAGESAPAPRVSWPFHLWPTAVPFVGYDTAGKKVRGRMIDLAEPFTFTRELELTYVAGGNRMLVRLGPGWGYELPATREPARWLGGYCTWYGNIKPLAWGGWNSTPYTKDKPLTFEFSLKLTPDEQAPILNKDGAREVTPERPFDFSALYQPDASRVYLEPVGRDVPIFAYDEDVEFRIQMPAPVLNQLPACDYEVRDAYTDKLVAQGHKPAGKRWWESNGTIRFKAPRPSVYVVAMQCVAGDGKVLADLTQEAVATGPIEQPVVPFGRELKLRLVDEVDCTQAQAGHAFYARSDRSRVVDTPAGKARKTLDNKEMARLGTTDLDWFGYRFKLADPTKVHVVEVVYPDVADLTMGVSVFEPDGRQWNGKPIGRCRVSSGVSAGGVYPLANTMQRMRTIYFPTAPWCTVVVSNIHCGSFQNGPPAMVSAIRLYELAEPLPRLPPAGPGADRLVGVYTESGELGMGAYGYNEVRGEFWGGFHVPRERFYREYYRAIENLIRHMRYRGDTVYIYGAYRYRSSRFRSVGFPPAGEVLDGDLLALMAGMFEHNGLKVLPCIQANQPLPIARLFRRGMHEIVAGRETSVQQVGADGATHTGHFGFMYSNPFHPATQDAWKQLAAELVQRYGDSPAVPGVGWLGSIWSPTLLRLGTHLEKDQVDRYYFGYTYDDVTMAQFAAEEKLTLPGKIGDPKRFQQRYEWIMKHARDPWIAFRCRKLAAMYKTFAAAVHGVRPDKKFYVVGQHTGFLSNAVVASPLETWRMYGVDPREYAGTKNLVYVHGVPDGSGLNIYEHGLMPREWMKQVRPFLDDAELYRAVEAAPATGRFLHRQFFENRLRFDPQRPWLFGRGQSEGEPLRLTYNFYPQPGGRHFLEDFALMLAHGTPELVCWMWCDGSVPMGHEDPLREFAAFLRTLPLGRYETVSETDGVFVRKLRDAPLYYVVNTRREPAVARLSVKGRATDLVTGQKLPNQAGQVSVPLKAAGMRSLRLD